MKVFTRGLGWLMLFSLGLLVFSAQAQEKRKKSGVIQELEKAIAGRENEPAEKVFKNIKMLKGVPAIRVLRIMENGFSPALGVKCTFCHVKGEWDSDEKPEKETAREMMKMVGKIREELKKIVDEKATINCFTCHRGEVEPALRPKK